MGAPPLGSTIPPLPAPDGRPLRLAVVATAFPDYSIELAAALAERHRVLLLIDRDQAIVEDAAERLPAGVRVVRISQRRLTDRAGGGLVMALRLALFRPQAVIAHEDGRLAAGIAQHAAALLSRLLLIVHDPLPHAGRDTTLAATRSRSLRARRRAAQVLLAHGATCAEQLRRLAPGRPVAAIPHGPILRPMVPPTAPPGEARFLMFGRMEAYKGLERLLAAWRLLAAEGFAGQLHLLGGGPELDRLQPAFAALTGVHVENRHASRAEAIAAFATADAVLLPYNEATQSGVAAAAFANGRPVIATGVGGLRDVVHDGVNGRCIDPADPALLAAAIRSHAEAPGELWRGALRSAEDELAWSGVAAAVVAAAGG